MRSNKLKMMGLLMVFVLLMGAILILNQMIDQEISKSSSFQPGLEAAGGQELTFMIKKKAPDVVIDLHQPDQKDISGQTKNNGSKDVKAKKQPRPRYETPLDDVELAL